MFQAKIDQTFEGCEGVVEIADDVVYSLTEGEHDQHMHDIMLNRCRATNQS